MQIKLTSVAFVLVAFIRSIKAINTFFLSFESVRDSAKESTAQLSELQLKVKVKNVSIFKLKRKQHRVTWSGVGGEAYGELK